MQYNKHKDANPTDTVKKIQSILDNIGLKTEVTWSESGVQNIHSNHVSIRNTSFGTNGKGTNKEFALASGYAELIERMQNGILKASVPYDRVKNATGFLYCPDEKIQTAKELAEQDDAFTKFYFDFFRIDSTEKKIDFLLNLPQKETLPYGHFRCLPFADLFSDRIVYIPADLLLPVCGSNGMSAGNTPEEALVQALSELLERYANKAVLDGVVPPEIPKAHWESTGICSLVNEIEQSGRYRVSIRDCSLGKGLPVTAVVISDCKNGTFGVHFGCHPSFEVSVERSLTEALQGKNLVSSASMNEIGNDHMCNSIDNGPNLMKLGYGAYPIGFFSDEPSYDFIPSNEWNNLTNLEMLKKLLCIIHRDGFDVFIRDASHLGFPAYHVLIPGMSELFFSNGQRMKELRTANRVIASLKHFPNLSQEEENRLLLYMKYKQFSIVENSFSWIANIPFKGDLFTTERIRAFLHYKRGEYNQAYEWFKRASALTTNEKEQNFLLCASEYAWLMSICGDPEKAARAVKCYFYADTADAVHNILHDPSQSLKKAYTPLLCYNCDNCPHKGIYCDYAENETALMKIHTAIAHSKVDQHNLLQFIKTLNIS